MKDVTDSMGSVSGQSLELEAKNKSWPASLGPQIFYTLRYFPELHDTRILFQLKKGQSGIISTRPTWGSIFKKRSRRIYIVQINDAAAPYIFPPFMKAPANAQVGILGHELCHIVYFKKRSGLELIGLGINHVSRKFMDIFEHNTDSADVLRGLGYQLIAWNLYLQKAFVALHPDGFPSPFENEGQRERYMRPSSIQQMIDRTPIYRLNEDR